MMHNITADYVYLAECALILTTLIYFLMNGAGIFETLVIIPRWSANPPESFALLRGIKLKSFWIGMHSFHEITFFAAIGFCWQLTDIRNALLVLFVVHFAVRIWTIVYFAPRIMAWQQNTYQQSQHEELYARTKRWRRLNYLRTAIFVAISVVMAILCLQLLAAH